MLGCTSVQKFNLFGNKQGSNFGENANCKIDSINNIGGVFSMLCVLDCGSCGVISVSNF